MHRDLKTENILLGADGHIKLTDFGVSKTNLNPIEGGRSRTKRLGTVENMAPEMLQQPNAATSNYGFSVDWYSLGIVIFEMLTGGEHPFTN
jgi:serine/threonine protein kinase